MAGFGGSVDRIEFADKAKNQAVEFANAHGHVGVGVERRFRKFSVGLELRAIGMKRDDEAHDGPAYVGQDAQLPRESEGAQLSLTGTYYF